MSCTASLRAHPHRGGEGLGLGQEIKSLLHVPTYWGQFSSFTPPYLYNDLLQPPEDLPEQQGMGCYQQAPKNPAIPLTLHILPTVWCTHE